MKMDDLEDRPSDAVRGLMRWHKGSLIHGRSRLIHGPGLLYGRRQIGRRGSYGDQYAATEFLHVFHLPFVPRRWVWVTQTFESGAVGHDIRPTLASTLAGYAIVWGPLVAIQCGLLAKEIAADRLVLIAISAAGVLATVWAMATRHLRRSRDQLRSDVNLRAFGTRCDPLLMTKKSAGELRGAADATWAQVAAAMTPEDVARRGGASPEQMIAAYAVLRLTARLGAKPTAAHALAASEAVLARLAGADPTAAADDGPYRAPP